MLHYIYIYIYTHSYFFLKGNKSIYVCYFEMWRDLLPSDRLLNDAKRIRRNAGRYMLFFNLLFYRRLFTPRKKESKKMVTLYSIFHRNLAFVDLNEIHTAIMCTDLIIFTWNKSIFHGSVGRIRSLDSILRSLWKILYFFYNCYFGRSPKLESENKTDSDREFVKENCC